MEEPALLPTAWPRPGAQGGGSALPGAPGRLGRDGEGVEPGASGFAEPNARCIYWKPSVCPVPSMAPHMYRNFLTLLVVKPEH